MVVSVPIFDFDTSQNVNACHFVNFVVKKVDGFPMTNGDSITPRRFCRSKVVKFVVAGVSFQKWRFYNAMAGLLQKD